MRYNVIPVCLLDCTPSPSSLSLGCDGSNGKVICFLLPPVSCPLHISRSDAPIVPRCCRLGQCEWVPGPESAVGASSGGRRAILNMFNIARRRRPIGRRTCTMQLRVVINKTPSPYHPGSRTILYDSLVPTDANVRVVRHSANVDGVPTRRRMVSSRFASDYIGGQAGHRIG